MRKRCLRLGESILKPIIESIEDINKGKKVVEENKPSFMDIEVLDLFKEHLQRMGVEAKFQGYTQ